MGRLTPGRNSPASCPAHPPRLEAKAAAEKGGRTFLLFWCPFRPASAFRFRGLPPTTVTTMTTIRLSSRPNPCGTSLCGLSSPAGPVVTLTTVTTRNDSRGDYCRLTRSGRSSIVFLVPWPWMPPADSVRAAIAASRRLPPLARNTPLSASRREIMIAPSTLAGLCDKPFFELHRVPLFRRRRNASGSQAPH